MLSGDWRNIAEKSSPCEFNLSRSFMFYRKVNWGFGCAVLSLYAPLSPDLFYCSAQNGLMVLRGDVRIKCCISWGDFWLTIIMTLWTGLIALKFLRKHTRRRLCPVMCMTIIHKLICENYDVEIHKYWWWLEGSRGPGCSLAPLLSARKMPLTVSLAWFQRHIAFTFDRSIVGREFII